MDGGGGNGMHHDMASHTNNGTMPHKMMMHMTFYWGKNALVLFHGWPGSCSLGMYVLALIFVFVLSVMVEWLSHSHFINKGSSHVSAGLLQTLVHTIRVGLSFLVMLALMSFNGGVFVVAVAGHSVGFLVFGSRVFKRENQGDLPHLSC